MTEKKYKKIHVFELVFFENLLLLLFSKNSLQTPSLDDILLGNFTLSNSIILVEDLIRPKRGFEIYPYDIENKNIAGK